MIKLFEGTASKIRLLIKNYNVDESFEWKMVLKLINAATSN